MSLSTRHGFLAFLCLIAPLAPRGSRREAAYFVVARRRKSVSAHSSAARRRAIPCTRARTRADSADRGQIRRVVRRNGLASFRSQTPMVRQR